MTADRVPIPPPPDEPAGTASEIFQERLTKREYEQKFNRVLETNVRWSKLSIGELQQIDDSLERLLDVGINMVRERIRAPILRKARDALDALDQRPLFDGRILRRFIGGEKGKTS